MTAKWPILITTLEVYIKLLLEACKEGRDMLGAIASGDPTQEILWTDLDAVLDKMNAAITAVEGHDA